MVGSDVADGSGVSVSVGSEVAVGSGVDVSVGGMGVADGVGVMVGEGVLVGVAVQFGVGVKVGRSSICTATCSGVDVGKSPNCSSELFKEQASELSANRVSVTKKNLGVYTVGDRA